jgi:glycosyltransferase involved in cell wall biosynthesis
MTRTKTLIFISDAVAEAHHFGWHAGRSIVLYYGVSDHQPQADSESRSLRSSLGIPDSSLILGYVAEMIAWKNHRTLLDAFECLYARQPNVHLVLVGTGELSSQLNAYAKALRSGGNVHFVGPRPDVRDLYPQMDIYVHPSDGEGFGLAVAEAMLAGRPVVASNTGALPEFVIDGQTGLLVDPHNHEEMAERITQLLGHAALRTQLGESARAYCLKHFSPERFAGAMTDILEKEVKL